MQANRKSRTRPDNRAQVGIGTMIVFIATVLVSAIAAAVLIDTGAKLQERSARTGQETTEQVSTNLNIKSIVGKRDTASETGLHDLEFYVALAPGARDIDLGQLRVQLSNGSSFETFKYNTDPLLPPDFEEFNATALRDPDLSFSQSEPVMTSGDLVQIWIDLNAAGIMYEPRDHVMVTMLPEAGTKVQLGFVTPTSYGQKLVIDLS